MKNSFFSRSRFSRPNGTQSSLKLSTLIIGALLLLGTQSACGGGSSGGQSTNVNERFSVVVQWNELMLSGIRNSGSRPTVTTRQMFIISTAMYDAWSAYDAQAVPFAMSPALKRPAAEHTEANQRAAVSQAAYHALVSQFAEYEANTGKYLTYLTTELGYEVTRDTSGVTPESIGFIAAQSMLAARSADGSNFANNYRDTTSAAYPALYTPVNSADPGAPNAIGGPEFDPNRWTPVRVPNGTVVDDLGIAVVNNDDPSSYADQVFLTPHWGAVEPFALQRPDQFRPPAPPQLGSSAPYTDALGRTMTNDEAWNIQFDEVLEASAALTDEEKVIAEFWADGPRSEAPPGHWNQLAHGVSARDSHSIGDDVKMFFALNGALLDAGIAVWEAKREYDSVRPVSAIRFKYAGQKIMAWAGPNQGTQEINGEDWRPYQQVSFVTPPFAEYVSGHSTFSRSAAEVLTAFTGSEVFYDGTTQTLEDVDGDGDDDFLGQHIQQPNSSAFESVPAQTVVLRWSTFREAANQAGISRIFGGIHIQDGDLRGREMGAQIGPQAFALARSYWTGTVAR